MSKHWILVDADSLYQTARDHYKGRVDYAALYSKIKSMYPHEFKAVVFHAEPVRTGSEGFQQIVVKQGFQMISIPPKKIGGTVMPSKSVPIHIAAYLIPRLGEFSQIDFISGDADYSPLSRYFTSIGKIVRLWLFSDRIPSFDTMENPADAIIPMNESVILSETPARKTSHQDIVAALETPAAAGCVTMAAPEVKTYDVSRPHVSSEPLMKIKDAPAGCANLEFPQGTIVKVPSKIKAPAVDGIDSLLASGTRSKKGIIE